jgi:hypothetical protein
LSRVEKKRLNLGDDPFGASIHRSVAALEVDDEELRILAQRVPEFVKKRLLQRPDAFCLSVQTLVSSLFENIKLTICVPTWVETA